MQREGEVTRWPPGTGIPGVPAGGERRAPWSDPSCIMPHNLMVFSGKVMLSCGCFSVVAYNNVDSVLEAEVGYQVRKNIHIYAG